MAAILFCVIGLFSFSGCTAKYKLSIKNEPNIAVLSRLKTRYAAGEQVMVVTEVVLDADVEVFLNVNPSESRRPSIRKTDINGNIILICLPATPY